MVFPTPVLVLMAVLGACTADNPPPAFDTYNPSYQYQPHQPHQPHQPSGHPDYSYHASRQEENLLDSIGHQLQALESKERTHLTRLQALTNRANANVDLMNNFNNYIYNTFQDHQAHQDERITDLMARINDIITLRSQVKTLHQDAESIQQIIQNTVYPMREQHMNEINGLQNADLTKQAELDILNKRVEIINEGIDALFRKAWANARQLEKAEQSVKAVFDSMNRQKSMTMPLVLSPSESGGLPAGVSLAFPQPFVGPPAFNQIGVTGFHFEKTHGYGYPAIYFGISNVLCHDRVNFDSVDMGSGGWSADKVYSQATFLYIDGRTVSEH